MFFFLSFGQVLNDLCFIEQMLEGCFGFGVIRKMLSLASSSHEDVVSLCQGANAAFSVAVEANLGEAADVISVGRIRCGGGGGSLPPQHSFCFSMLSLAVRQNEYCHVWKPRKGWLPILAQRRAASEAEEVRRSFLVVRKWRDWQMCCCSIYSHVNDGVFYCG